MQSCHLSANSAQRPHSPASWRLHQRAVRLIVGFVVCLLALTASVTIRNAKGRARHGTPVGGGGLRLSAELQRRVQLLQEERAAEEDALIAEAVADFRAAFADIRDTAAVLGDAIGLADARIDAFKKSIVDSPDMPAAVRRATASQWGLDDASIAASEKKAAENAAAIAADPQRQKQQREAAIRKSVERVTAEVRRAAAEALSSVRTAALNAEDTAGPRGAFVRAVEEERFGNPSRGAPQWRNGMGDRREAEAEEHRQRHLRVQQHGGVGLHNHAHGHGVPPPPNGGGGMPVDPNDRLDLGVEPPDHHQQQYPHGREHVIPRRDYQHSPHHRNNNNGQQQQPLHDSPHAPANARPLGDYAGVVRMPGDQFVDYDNDFYHGVVNDVPGPAYVHPHDPISAIENKVARNDRRAERIVEAFKHSWKAYAQHAWGCDELKPRSRSCKNWGERDGPLNGFGLTILDGMTTAQLMGLTAEVEDSLKYVKHNLNFRSVDVDGSVFEANIRALGGLLSMYELTGERHQFLLDKAVEVADVLLFAFNTTTGLPHSTVNFKTRRHFGSPWGGGNAVLSEFGTMQLEFRTLSYHTGDPIYDMKATHVMAIIEAKAPADFLMPLYMSSKRLTWATDHISVGALGDSFYEYVIKQYVLTGNTEERYARLAAKMMKGLSKLLFRSKPGNSLYIAEHRARSFYHKMDHLACFAGGMFAMLAQEMPDLTDSEAAHIMRLAGDLTETCVHTYTRQASGVGPEYVEFPAGADFVNGQGAYYILRPETIESVFYMWRYTRDEKWREYGWRMFRAIDRFCRVPYGGYVGIREVNIAGSGNGGGGENPPQDNLMQSFWLAETLKYFYLLFSDDSVLDLNDWVFNTEAHPLRRRTRDPLDVWRSYEEAHGAVPWFPPPLQGVRNTETAKMMAMRRAGVAKLAVDMGSDPHAGDSGEEGMPDDEGLPFDEANGPRGISRDRRTMRDVLIDEGRQFDYSRVRKDGRFIHKFA